MRPEIRVLTDHSRGHPDRVFWYHACRDNQTAWLCVKDITEFLESHEIGYYVLAFQVNQTIMDIPNPEHRTMIRLSVPLYVDDRKDDMMGGVL